MLPPALRKKIVSGEAGARSSLTRKTLPSTSPTKEWTRVVRKKETRERPVVLPVPPTSKENGKKVAAAAIPFYPDILFIGRAESPAVSDDEPTAPGEEPPQRESRRRRNGHGSRGRRRPGKGKLFFPFLRPQRRTERNSPRQQCRSTPTSSSSGEQSRPPSPTTNRPRLEKNHLSENPADEGTDAGTFDDITQLEKGIRSSLSRETRSQR